MADIAPVARSALEALKQLETWAKLSTPLHLVDPEVQIVAAALALGTAAAQQLPEPKDPE